MIYSPQGDDYKNCCLLICDESGKNMPTFHRIRVPPALNLKMQAAVTKLHGVTSHKTAISPT
jgi:hypothetical protein